MQKESKYLMPETATEDIILEMFLKTLCGQEETWIANKHKQFITLNCRITDNSVTDAQLLNYGFERKNGIIKKEKIIPEIEGIYTESPVIEINDINKFKKSMFEFVKAYCNKSIYWAYPNLAENWKEEAQYAMLTMWTDATRQDFENPVAFIDRYKAFLTEDQWSDLQTKQKIKDIDDLELYKEVRESTEERETPYGFKVYAVNKEGRKYYFPTVYFGISDGKAYIYAVHNTDRMEKETLPEALIGFRNEIKGRGSDPFAIYSLLSFMQEAKKRGIKHIVIPDDFILQYTSKNKIEENYINAITGNLTEEEKKTKIQKMREEKDDSLEKQQSGSMKNRINTVEVIRRYFTTGIEQIEIPGEVSDNYTLDITNMKIGREEKQVVDHRKQKREGIEER